MEKVIKRLVQEQNTEKRSLSPHTFVKNIAKFERDKLFKGHTGYISYGQYEDESSFINVTNRYYNVTLMNQYYFVSDKTIITATTEFPITKYFKSFLDNLTNKGHYILADEEGDSTVDNMIMYRADDYYFYITYTYNQKGFMAFNHFDNLKIVKTIRDIVRKLKSIVRENGDDPNFYTNIRYVKDEYVYISKELFK